MFLASISGACSRSGKTALAVSLLRAAGPGVAAVKFTTTEDVFQRCPRGTPCVVCDIDVPFRLVVEDSMLSEPGTDTRRLADAGASRVVWAIARVSAVTGAWAAVQRIVQGAVVVMEGSTIVDVARPDLHLFVAHPFLSPDRWKPTSPRLVAACDAVIVNRPADERRPPSARVWGELVRYRGRDDLRLADVTRPLEAWAPDLAARLTAAVGPTAEIPA